MATWIPGYTRVDLGPDGGPYDQTNNPKGCLHTTEGSSFVGAEASFRNYPPHLLYDPRNRIKRQYVRLDRHSYAFRGAESDDDQVIQVELVGFADSTHLWSDQYYRNIAEDVLTPLEELVGIPRRTLRFYGAHDGIILASPNSPIRLSQGELRNYSGWLGHQHIPSPDEHWDPGDLLIHKSFDWMTMADSDLVTDTAHRLLNFLQNRETQVSGPSVGTVFPMVKDLNAAKYRILSLIRMTATVEGGPTDTEANELVEFLQLLDEKVDKVITQGGEIQTELAAIRALLESNEEN